MHLGLSIRPLDVYRYIRSTILNMRSRCLRKYLYFDLLIHHRRCMVTWNRVRRRDRMKSASNDEEADDDDDRVPPPLQKRFRGSAAKSGGNGGLALTPIHRTKLLEFLIIEAEQPLFDELLNLDVGSERTRLTVERLPDSLDYSVHGDLVPFKRLRLSDL